MSECNTETKRRSLYNEVKATQAACLLLQLNDGEMDYAKCIKILYKIEREALLRWTRPVIYDKLCSMPNGQVVSQTLDRAEYRPRKPKSFWCEHLETDAKNTIRVVKQCGIEQLSRAEIALIKEVYAENKHKSAIQLFKEHHTPALFPEWKDPQGSSIETQYSVLLTLLGKSEGQIKELEAELDELENLQALTR
jgi:hypothetical protein